MNLFKAVRLAVFLHIVAWTPFAIAQADYPSRPIRLIEPAAPGGGLDFIARLLAQKLAESLKQPVVVDNRPGAGGNIGVEMVAKAPPDGYTLLMPTSAFPINPSLYTQLPFDTVKDFSPIVLTGTAPLMLVVHPSVEAKTVRELVALAKRNPGTLNYASDAANTASLAAELFKKSAGVNIVGIPYRGASLAMTDLLSGTVHLYFGTIPAVNKQVEAGKLRVLAVSSAKRLSMMPNVPTVAESGLPGFEVNGWFGLFAPAGTPAPIIAKLNKETVAILNMPEVRKKFEDAGIIPGGGTPADLGRLLNTEITKWGAVIKEAGISRN